MCPAKKQIQEARDADGTQGLDAAGKIETAFAQDYAGEYLQFQNPDR
jgi:hypothetical protein